MSASPQEQSLHGLRLPPVDLDPQPDGSATTLTPSFSSNASSSMSGAWVSSLAEDFSAEVQAEVDGASFSEREDPFS